MRVIQWLWHCGLIVYLYIGCKVGTHVGHPSFGNRCACVDQAEFAEERGKGGLDLPEWS